MTTIKLWSFLCSFSIETHDTSGEPREGRETRTDVEERRESTNRAHRNSRKRKSRESEQRLNREEPLESNGWNTRTTHKQ